MDHGKYHQNRNQHYHQHHNQQEHQPHYHDVRKANYRRNSGFHDQNRNNINLLFNAVNLNHKHQRQRPSQGHPGMIQTKESESQLLIYKICCLAFKAARRFTFRQLSVQTIVDSEESHWAVFIIQPPLPLAADIPKDLAVRLLADDDGDITALFTVATEVNGFWFERTHRPHALGYGQDVLSHPRRLVTIEFGELKPNIWQSYANQAMIQFPERSDELTDDSSDEMSDYSEMESRVPCATHCPCGARLMLRCSSYCDLGEPDELHESDE